MSASVENFFTPPEGEAMRDGGGRPLLVPVGVDPSSGIRASYTRASSMADHLEDKSHIHRWEMRYLAKALGRHEDLAALAATETYSTGLTNPTIGRDKSASGRRLDKIIERALDRERIHEKADWGTAVHGFTEPGGAPAEAVPERMRPQVRGFWDWVRVNGVEIVGTEQFTANDATMSAGTFDHLVRVPGDPTLSGCVIADKKTGRYSPFEWCVQLATYAYGQLYDTDTDARLAWPGPINLDWGLVIQIGDDGVQGHLVDLRFGWEMAQLAAAVRDAHARNDIAVGWSSRLSARVEAANSVDDLRVLWHAADAAGDTALCDRILNLVKEQS